MLLPLEISGRVGRVIPRLQQDFPLLIPTFIVVFLLLIDICRVSNKMFIHWLPLSQERMFHVPTKVSIGFPVSD